MDHVTLARLASRALRRSMAESLYLNSGINLTKPNDIRATLTERCNFRCVYCDHWRQDSYADELTLEQWQAALQSIRDYVGRFAVQFLGGEPMLMPWFFELAAFCHARGIDWGVVTNGSSLSADRVGRLVAAMPLNIDVSIDSRGEAVNDRLRGWKGAMRRTAAGITALAAAREAAGARFPIRVKTVVSRDNIDDLDELVAWAASMPGVTIDLSPVRLWRQDRIDALYPAGPDEMDRLGRAVDRLKRARQSGAPIETSDEKLDAMMLHFGGAPNKHGVAACRVGLRSLDIRPNGDVNHCWNFARIGNLTESSMADIWTAAGRREVVDDTLACGLFKTTCSTSCHAHRRLVQDVARGIAYRRAGARRERATVLG